MFDQLFNGSNLYDLFMKDSEAINRFDSADKEIQESLNRVEEYINSNGTDLEKEAFKIYKEFMGNDEEVSVKDTTKNIEEIESKIGKISRKE